MVRRQRALRRSVRAVHRPRSLRVPDAVQPGRFTRDAWRSAQGGCSRRRFARLRRACDLADLRRALSAVSRDADTAVARPCFFDRISARLADDAYRPRAVFERFNLEVLATTESPLDALSHHQAIRASGW